MQPRTCACGCGKPLAGRRRAIRLDCQRRQIQQSRQLRLRLEREANGDPVRAYVKSGRFSAAAKHRRAQRLAIEPESHEEIEALFNAAKARITHERRTAAA